MDSRTTVREINRLNDKLAAIEQHTGAAEEETKTMKRIRQELKEFDRRLDRLEKAVKTLSKGRTA